MSGRPSFSPVEPDLLAATPMRDLPDLAARPLIVAGMHRSGTSLTASLFAGAGIDFGPELLGANASNPLGHFEDIGFLLFHQRALVAQGLGSEGYATGVRIRVPAALDPEARGLLASRMRPGVAWGWKEPRTTLFLDFWQELLPEARHVFVFRPPWEVADSLFRRGDETFALNPMLAVEVWSHYNRLILDFARRHPSRCLVVGISQVVADPAAVVAEVRSRLEVPLGPPVGRFVDTLLHRDEGSTRAALVRSLAPEAWQIYAELQEAAGCDDQPRAERSLGESVMLEWARASRTAVAAREAEVRMNAETERRVRAETDRVRAETEARVRAETEARIRAEYESHRTPRTALAAAVRSAARRAGGGW